MSNEESFETFDMPGEVEISAIDDLTETNAQKNVILSIFWRYQQDPDFDAEQALQAFNYVLQGHGIEAVNPEGSPNFRDNGKRMCPPFSYVNMGDSYIPTIARDHEFGRWVIASWADLLEETEKRHKLGDWEEFTEEPERCVQCGGRNLTLETAGDGDTYAWSCNSCNHSHRAAADFEPPASEVCKNCGKLQGEHYDSECPEQDSDFEPKEEDSE